MCCFQGTASPTETFVNCLIWHQDIFYFFDSAIQKAIGQPRKEYFFMLTAALLWSTE